MHESVYQGLEEWGIDPYPQSTSNKPLQEQSNFRDSSWPFLSIYSKAAEDKDNEMVKRWQNDALGSLIFSGLFSAAVAALLAVTVQDLRPNSQDTSAFYLGNIYQVLADPNVTRSSIPSPVTKPPPFSPPRHAVWVNSLFSLSLVMALSCALLATSLHQWARRYIRLAQPVRCSPEKRARMRAFFANGMEKMHVPWAVEGLPTLIHLSLFLFFAGLLIYLFNIDHEVFIPVVWWIGLFSMTYGLITILPIIRHDSPYNSPLSTSAWFLYVRIRHLTFKILASITPGSFRSSQTWRFEYLRRRYQEQMSRGVEEAAEETVLERSSEINVQILDWTINALDDDDSLKDFFKAIPGFFDSESVKGSSIDFDNELLQKFRDVLDGFLSRTWSSIAVDDPEKVRRFDIAMNAMNLILKSGASFILWKNLFKHWDEMPQTLENGHTLASWCTSGNRTIAQYAQATITRILVSVRERNDNWVTLATRIFDLPVRDLHYIALGDDSVLLAIFIHATHQSLRSDCPNYPALEALSKLDIRNAHPRLQHEFCTLWNDIVQEARNQGPSITLPVDILRSISHLYIALHQGTDAAPTAFSVSTDNILLDPSSYPFCNLASHRPDSIAQIPVPNSCEALLPAPLGNSPDDLSPSSADGNNTDSRQADEIGTTSHGLDMTPPTNPVHPSSRPTGASPTAVVAAAPQDITSTTTFFRLKGNEKQDSGLVVPSTEPGTGQILSTASTHTPTPAPPPPRLNTPSESYDTAVYSSHFAPPAITSSIPSSPPTGSTTLLRLRARGLVNTRNICFANAVLQLLVNSPPFRNLLKELGDLKMQRGAGVPETGGSATPLVDATLRFLKEFIVEESQAATGGTSRADEEGKEFEPTYMYDGMKEKRQLKPLLDGQQQDAEEFLCLYLDALDEELLLLLAPISGRQSTSAAFEVEEREVSQSGKTEVGSQGLMVNFIESPITRIFGGKFRSSVRAPNKPDINRTEDWRSLHLDIQPDEIRTVQDALSHISHPLPVQVSTSGLGNASQQVLIEALPPVLVLHLDRVRYDATAGGIMKIGKFIQLAPELEIPLDIMVPDAQRPSEPPHYKLFGVLHHHGESAGGGHYTVDVLHPNGDVEAGEVWLHIDDEAVSPMRHEDVFGEDDAERVADERCTYLLFYCRTSPMRTS